MNGLTRDGPAESVSRDRIFRHERGQGKQNPVQLITNRIDDNHTRLIYTLLYVIHTIIVTRFSRSMENERFDAERDGRACLARPNFHARTGAGCKVFALFSQRRAELTTKLS